MTGKEKLVLVSGKPNPEVESLLALVSSKYGATFRTVEDYKQTGKVDIILQDHRVHFTMNNVCTVFVAKYK